MGATTVGVAVVSSAATTAAVSATNTSMNAEGDMFKQSADISKQTAKDTTSKESLENMAIAGTTAALTFGITQGVSELTNSANAANTTSAANGSNGINSATQISAIDPNLTTLNLDGFPATSLASSGINNSTTLTSRFLTALQNSSIQTISASAAQSTIKGDSFSEAFKNQLTNIIINAAGEIVANEIGTSYKTGEINKTTQLTAHAALGCAMAAAGSNNCAAGAASGIAAEIIGQSLKNNTNLTDTQIINSGKLTGAITSTFIVGPDDGDSVFAGAEVGRNAVANNLTMVISGTDKNQKHSSSKDLDQKFRIDVEETFDEKLTEFEWSGGNTKEARSEAADNLNNIISLHQFKPGEKLNLVGFSHGGNIIKEFTQLYYGDKKIDNIALLGTPNRSDYYIDFSDIVPNTMNKINIYDLRDGVQSRGYIDGSVYRGIVTVPHNIQTLNGFLNIFVNQNSGSIDNHLNLPSFPIWNENVKPILIK